MRLEQNLIQHKGFRNLFNDAGEAIGFQVCIRQRIYRGTWLSQFRFNYVVVDGVTYGPKDCTFTIGGIEYTYDELHKYDRRMWSIKEMCFIKVKKPGGLEMGAHKVHVSCGEIRSYLPPRMDVENIKMSDQEPGANVELIMV